MGEDDGRYALRYLEHIGTRARLSVFWKNADSRCLYGGEYHRAVGEALGDSPILEDRYIGGAADDYPDDRWPTNCEHCGIPTPPVPGRVLCRCGCGLMLLPPGAPIRDVMRRPLWGTLDRKHVDDEFAGGDCYFADWYACGSGHCVWGWANCTGKHLIVILPTKNLHPWDTNGRASNCTMKDEKTHRCWVVHGDPARGEIVTVDKDGHTCQAGAGSIDADGWHGKLTLGILRRC